jgi:hypothetical protein
MNESKRSSSLLVAYQARQTPTVLPSKITELRPHLNGLVYSCAAERICDNDRRLKLRSHELRVLRQWCRNITAAFQMRVQRVAWDSKPEILGHRKIGYRDFNYKREIQSRTAPVHTILHAGYNTP